MTSRVKPASTEFYVERAKRRDKARIQELEARVEELKEDSRKAFKLETQNKYLRAKIAELEAELEQNSEKF